MFQGFKWTKAAEDRIAILKMYEPLQPYLLLELTELLNADTFIDVGANIGAYTILMSSLDRITSIHAFEPSPRTSDELAANVALNEHSRKVTLYKTALSDSKRDIRFGIVADYSGANSIVDTSIHGKEKFSAEVIVDCLPLDSILTFRERTISLKIDVEGHEKAVLTGARKLLIGNRGIMQIENYNPASSDLDEILNSYGYRYVFRIGPDYYWTNMELDDKDIVRIFEKASDRLIKSNFERPMHASARLRLPGGITVEVSRTVANVARKLKSSLMQKRRYFGGGIR
jgi:FkbM family methyltransferase